MGKKKTNVVIEEVNQSGIINFYENEECKKIAVEHVNPNYNADTMSFKHPFHSIIVGATGSGKSNILLNLINKMSGTFEYIYIFTQDKSEQLYEFLESKIEKPYLQIYEGIDKCNEILRDAKLDKAQYLFIYDDFVIEPEKKQMKICEMYVRSRKMAQKCGVSNIYLTQSYYDTPSIIRKQSSYLVFKKINGKREINALMRDCSSLDSDRKQLQTMYNYCVASAQDISNFMLIDKKGIAEKTFRKNFAEILNPDEFII